MSRKERDGTEEGAPGAGTGTEEDGAVGRGLEYAAGERGRRAGGRHGWRWERSTGRKGSWSLRPTQVLQNSPGLRTIRILTSEPTAKVATAAAAI